MNQYRQLFASFFKIGAFTIGGGYAMIPLIQKEVVTQKKWIDADEFIALLSLAQSAPGPIAVNTAIFVGYKVRGIKGALTTTLGAILPSLIIIILIAAVFTQIHQQPAVERIFKGIRPAVVALILVSVIQMAKKSNIGLKNSWIPIGVVLVVVWANLSPVLAIIGAILAGIGYGLYKNKSV